MDDITEATAKLVAAYKQWAIGTGQAGFVLPKARFKDSSDRNYNLKNSRIRKFLQYEEQTFGINLGWTNDAEPTTGRKVSRWFFARNGKNTGPVKFGETIAMGYGTEPSFVHYNHRTIGINLDWSTSPRFEWKIIGGTPGQPVPVSTLFAIYNTKAEGDLGPGECLMFFDRTRGGDIGWPSSKTWGEQLRDLGMKLAEKAAKEAAEAAIKALLTGGGG